MTQQEKQILRDRDGQNNRVAWFDMADFHRFSYFFWSGIEGSINN